jgi:hypothetical protein
MNEEVQSPSMPSSTSNSVEIPQSSNITDSSEGNLPSAKSITQEFEKPSQSTQPEVFDVKVNGRIQKMTRQEVIDHASMSYAANQKFNEAKSLKAEHERLTSLARKNPLEALLDPSLGLSKDQIRDAMEEWYNREFIEPETLSPEQRQIKQYELELKKYQDQERERKDQYEKDQLEKLTSTQRDYLQKQIIDALETSGLPKTKFFASRMAFYMQQNFKNGWEAPLEMIINQVKNERRLMMGDLTEQSDAKQIIDMLGEGVINKIRKYDLEQLRAKRSGNHREFESYQDHSSGKGSKDTRTVNQRLRDIRMGKF